MIHRLWIEKEGLIDTLARLKKWLIGALTKILPNGVCRALYIYDFWLKEPRPSAEELLQTPFFKGPKKKSYLINTILSMSLSSYLTLNLISCVELKRTSRLSPNDRSDAKLLLLNQQVRLTLGILRQLFIHHQPYTEHASPVGTKGP